MSENIPLLPQTPSAPRRRLKSASTAPSTVMSQSQRQDNLPAIPMLPSALTSFSDAKAQDPLGLASKRSFGQAAGVASRMRKGSAMELGRYGARSGLRDEQAAGSRSSSSIRPGGASLDVDRSIRAVPNYAYSPLFTSGLINTGRPRVERAHTVDVSTIAPSGSLSSTRSPNMPTTPSQARPGASPANITPEHRDYTQDLARFGAKKSTATFASPARSALSASQSSNKSVKTSSPSMLSASTSASPSAKSLRSVSSKSSLRPSAARDEPPVPPLPLPTRSLDLPRQASFGMLRKKSSMPAIDLQLTGQYEQPAFKAPSRPPRPFEGLGKSKREDTSEEPQEELLSDLPYDGRNNDAVRPSMDAPRPSLSRDRLGLPLPVADVATSGAKKSNGPWSSFGRMMGRKVSAGPSQAGFATPPKYRPSLDAHRPSPTAPPSGPLPEIPRGRPSYSAEMASRPSFAHDHGVRPSFQIDATPVAAARRASPAKTPTPATVAPRSGFEPETPPPTVRKTTSKIKKWFSRTNLKEAAQPDGARAKGRSPLGDLGHSNISPPRKLTLPPLKEHEVIKALPARPSPPRPSPASSLGVVSSVSGDKSRSSSAFEYTAFETGSAHSRTGSVVSDSDKENVEPNIAPARQAARKGVKYHLPSSSSLNKAYARSNAAATAAPLPIPLIHQDDRRGTWGLTEAFASMGMDLHDQDVPSLYSPIDQPSPALDSSIEWEYNDFCEP